MGDKRTSGPIDSNLCTGCGMCANICPVQAIKMQPDAVLGHLRPQIEADSCINCKLCEKKCPCITSVGKNKILETFAAWAKDDNVHYTSSSGGVASSIYKYVIANNGLIVGVSMTGMDSPKFECTGEQHKIQEFKRSKYLQADHNGIYKKVLDELKRGKVVAFIGLPCQCAAMKRIAEHHDETLFLVDLICHGTPSFELFKQYLKHRFPGKNITRVKFRDPERGEVLSVYESDCETYKRSYKEDPYLYAFMYGDLLADCCYNCKYAAPQRIGDLTIGDFWGLGKKIPFDKSTSRVSCVLINTKKGKKLFENVKSYLEYEKRPIEEAIEGNTQLQKATPIGENRDEMIAFYKQGDAGNGLINLYGNLTEKNFKRRVRKEFVKRLGKLLGLKKIRDFLRKCQ